MGLWDGITRIGKGIGRAVSRPVRGIGRIARGNFREGFGDIGHGIKRGAQAAALVGSGGTYAIPLAGAGGMLERATEEDASFGNVLGAGVSGASGAAAAQSLGNIGRSVAGRVGGQAVTAGGVSNLGKLAPGQIPGQAALSAGMTPGVPKAMEIGKYAGNAVGSGGGVLSMGSPTPLSSPTPNIGRAAGGANRSLISPMSGPSPVSVSAQAQAPRMQNIGKSAKLASRAEDVMGSAGGRLGRGIDYLDKHPTAVKFAGDMIGASQDDPADKYYQDRMDLEREDWELQNSEERRRQEMLQMLISSGAWRS